MFFYIFYYNSTLTLFSIIQFHLNAQFFIYFVVSEVFFFFGIFWVLFWFVFSYDSCYLLKLMIINPFGLALFNTFLLLLSSTFGILHHLKYLNYLVDYNLYLSIFLGIFFLFNQFLEFKFCFYNISVWSFGSIFFFGTGFHGFHVFLGLVLLILSVLYYKVAQFQIVYFLNCSLLYWHFVDVIWLFLFTILYIVIFYLYTF